LPSKFTESLASLRSTNWLSSPLVNVLWSLLNMLLGYYQARVGRLSTGGNLSMALFFAGIAVLSTMSSVTFARKLAECLRLRW
jgi:hypothetical protein